MTSQRVLLIGATQGTGLLIAQQLLGARTPIRVLARNLSKAQALFGADVDIVQGDITNAATLTPVLQDVSDVVCTAGVTQRPASEQLIRTTEFEGMQNVLTAAQHHGLPGRFLYMTSIGISQASFAAWLLNRVKGNTLYWREQVEETIRASHLCYSIIRCGVLTNAHAGHHPIALTQGNQALTFGTRISRGDVARVCLSTLQEPAAQNATFEVVWGQGQEADMWKHQLKQLKADDMRTVTISTA